MSTNYYWAELGDDDSIRAHIGKTSNAGQACNECGIARMANSDFMHYGEMGRRDHGDTCPMCDEPWTGTATTFTWTAFSHRWRLERLVQDGDEAPVVIDEYGVPMSAAEVFARLPSVTIHRLSSVEFC